jgi:hypothetical protein
MSRKAKKDNRGQVLIDKDELWRMKDPHARRYFHANRELVRELVDVLCRWNVHLYEGRLYLTLPPDKDNGIYMKKPGLIKRLAKRVKK